MPSLAHKFMGFKPCDSRTTLADAQPVSGLHIFPSPNKPSVKWASVKSVDHLLQNSQRNAAVTFSQNVDPQGQQHSGSVGVQRLADAHTMRPDNTTITIFEPFVELFAKKLEIYA
uniref:Uncharacterized protein n=1 Tax=Romanomermis culicivorax TaxID=13658 RepID=A0A915K4V4_ROMCU